MRRVGVLALATLVFCSGLASCAKSPEAKVQAQVQAVKKERSTDNLVRRGKLFAAAGDLTRAEQYLAAALDEGGDARVVLPFLLRVCVESGRYRVAIEHARNQLNKHPDDAELRFLLATLYVAIDEDEAAQGEFAKLLKAHPEHADAHYALAVLCRDQLGSPVRADHHFREYLRLRPSGEHAEEARASLLKSVP